MILVVVTGVVIRAKRKQDKNANIVMYVGHSIYSVYSASCKYKSTINCDHIL